MPVPGPSARRSDIVEAASYWEPNGLDNGYSQTNDHNRARRLEQNKLLDGFRFGKPDDKVERLSPTALDAIRCLVADADAEAEASPPLVPFDSYEYSIVGTLIATNLYVQLKSLSDT
ncbi:hypothetical protein CVT25_001720 [Psilocybe cyanescens]|uniref:Uncharacterized protein n=1 Tax=Psilocybe cyanescens TaxID=93625 RepID=A0A409WPI2_PSICY|nr:hypothetical protein CVT25_001720 [Psilocybe cyanescens]